MGKAYEGKAVVVTGSGGKAGIGRAMALRFASEGASVVVNDIGTAEDGTRFADMVVNEIQAKGGKAVANYDSVATMEGGAAIIKTCVDNFGKIDVLVNNAGNHIMAGLIDGTEKDLDCMYDIHVKGMFACAQAAAKQMISQGHGGAIINFSSTSAFSGSFAKGQQCLYGMVKAAVLALTLHTSYSLAEHGITVNSILPDAVSKINMNEGKAVPLGHNIPLPVSDRSPEHVAAIVAYLASDKAIEKKVSRNHVYVAGSDFVIFSDPCMFGSAPDRFFRNGNGQPWELDELDEIPWNQSEN